ncbi:universal stress protein [Thalassovita sp.]|jgi:nucleotide-binding universal stress UspA family protein|uniref:universal stress protein n=1 Tax=Thalassovita sp. TaxID=1979401 RepID=UPI003B5BC45C
MSKHILVATDLSPRADRAVRRAVRLAKGHQARLTVLHVLDDHLPDEMLRHLQPKTTEHLDRFMQTVAPDLAYDLLPCIGHPTETILEMIQDQDPSLVVMGMHRTRPVLDSLRETTVQRVVRLTDYPVLVVADTVDHPYQTIMAATDFSPSSAAALNLGHSLAPTAQITPVNALHVPYRGRLAGAGPETGDALAASFLAEAQDADAAWRAGTALPVSLHHTQFVEGSPYSTLKSFAEQGQAQLITAGAHGRAGDYRALLGSLANDLLRDPPCDVLIARKG